MARFEVGTAFLKITASVEGIHRDVEREVRRIRDVEIEVSADTERFRRDVRDATRTMRGVSVDVVANTEHARVQVGAFAQQMEKRLAAATRSLGDIRIDGDSGPVERKIWAVRQQLATLQNQRVGIDIDADVASRRIDAIHAELTRLSRLSPNIQVKVDTAAALAQLAALRKGFDDTGRGARAQVSELSSHMSQHTALMQLAISAGMLAISAAVGPALAVIGMIPTALLGVATPAAALAIGFVGVGDAIDAMAAAQQAATGTAADQAAANEKLAQAMAKLTPEAQEFVRTWTGELIPAMRTVRAMVSSELFPGLEQSLHNIQPLIPIIADGLADATTVIGELTAKGTAMMASGPWRNDFAQIMESNNRALRSWGEAGLSVLDMLRNLMAATGPITERFASFAQQAAATFAAFIEGKRATGELGLFFQQMGDALAQLGSVLGQTASGLYDFATAIAPMGMLFLQAVAGLVELIGNLAQANPLLAQIAVVALGLAPAFRFAATAATALGTAFTFLIGGGLATKLSAAALSAGALTTSFTGSAAAGEKAAAAGGKVANAVTRIGQALPFVGAALIAANLAWDAYVTNADEAAAALMKGGTAADQMTQKMTSQTAVASGLSASYNPILAGIGQLIPTMDDARNKVDGMRAAMDPLARAQSLAAEASTEYLNVLNKVPGDTAAVTAAYERWITATEEEKRQQEALEQALSKTTEGIKKQQDAIIGAVDAEVQYRNSLQDLTEAVTENGSSTDILTQKGRDVIAAFSDVVQAARGLDEKLIESKAPPEELAAAHADHVAALKDAAAKMGLHGPEIDRLIQAYQNAKPPVDDLSSAISGMPVPKPVVVSVDTLAVGPAIATAKANIASIPEFWLTRLMGDTLDIAAKVATGIAAINTVPGQRPVVFLGDTASLDAAIALGKANIETVPKNPLTRMLGDAFDVVAKSAQAVSAINSMPESRTATLKVQDLASAAAAYAKRQVEAFQGIYTAILRVQQQGAVGGVMGVRQAAGGVLAPMATGGVLPMARGDNLTPMSGSVARIVPPNTWRVIGDRMVDDEAFIPINDSPWSTAILGETARRKGFELMPMAHGGLSNMNWRDPRTWDWIRRLLGSLLKGRPGGPPAAGSPTMLRSAVTDMTRTAGFGADSTAKITSATHGVARGFTYGQSSAAAPRGTGGSPPPLEIRIGGGGSSIEQLFMEVFRKVVRVQGGDVRLVFKG